MTPTTGQHAEPRDGAGNEDLPPRPEPGASADERARAFEARQAARFGAPTLEHFRRAYAGFGADWPGDDVIRQRHLVADLGGRSIELTHRPEERPRR